MSNTANYLNSSLNTLSALNPNASGIVFSGGLNTDLFDGVGPYFSAAEIEFIAESTLIQIRPRINMEELHFLTESIGPLRVKRPVVVPLWMAVVLRKGGHCEIIPPMWLNVTYLQSKLNDEYKFKDDYQDLPHHYLEISTLIFECGAVDIPDSEKCRQLIQGLREVRHQKTLEGLKSLDGDSLKLNNIGRMELNEIRPFLLPVMDRLVTLGRAKLSERIEQNASGRTFNSNF